MTQLEKRWEARQSGLEPLTVTTSARLDAPGDEVWSFLMDPRSDMLLNPAVVRSFHVPGTPQGEVGQQMCVVMNAGGRLVAHINELIAVDAPHRWVARWPTMATDVLSTMLLRPDADGTVLTYQLGMRVEAGTGKKHEPVVRASMDEELARIRVAIESGARFPTP